MTPTTTLLNGFAVGDEQTAGNDAVADEQTAGIDEVNNDMDQETYLYDYGE